MIKIFQIALLFFAAICVYGQERFSQEVLENPKKFGSQVESSFNISEVYEFTPEDKKNTVYLQNGLRSSTYLNPDDWLSISDKVEAVSVTLVFSKYPIRKNGYCMSHPLLFNRLKNLFAIDPFLNDENLKWEIILHTHCVDDAQVDELFHGVIIEYESQTDIIASQPDSLIEFSSEGSLIIIQKEKPLDSVLVDLNAFYEIPDSISIKISSMKEDEKKDFMIQYFEEKLESTDTIIITKKYLDEQEDKLNGFLNVYSYGNDSTVFKVMDRHEEWNNILVVADWTGSMYMYGAQILLWHTLHFDHSNIRYFTLFNDGDAKTVKKVGETGGIYFEEADKIDDVFDLYQMVMLKGSGGDGPENDIEGILNAIEKYPDHESIILIADNNSSVRDIELVSQIDKPVKVIVCGYRERTGIHPDYVRIAYETGGSIHTIEDDIYNILIETDNKGVITGIVDSDIKVSTSLGSYTSKYRVTINPEQVFTDIDSAIAHKNYVQKLDLTSKAYDKVPKQISRFKKLRYLDLSDNNIDNINYIVCGREKLLELRMANNKIKKIPKRIEKLMLLKVIDLSDNLIDTICPEFMSLRQLEYCDLSGNQIRYIPRMNFRKLKYLYLDDNQLAVIPSYLGIMKNLVELSLSGNYLKQIPKKIGYLKKLEVLDLSDNNITSLPNSFVKLKALRMLRISGNQISKEEFERIREMLPNTTIEYN